MSIENPPSFFQNVAPPRADRTGNDRDAVQTRKSAAVEILRRDVFERLPFRHDVDSIADFGVSGDRADSFRRQNDATSAPIVFGVNSVSASSATMISPFALCQPKFKRFGFAAICFGENFDFRDYRRIFSRTISQVLSGRTVVNDDNFKILIIRTSSRLSIVRQITFSSLKAGTTTETNGL